MLLSSFRNGIEQNLPNSRISSRPHKSTYYNAVHRYEHVSMLSKPNWPANLSIKPSSLGSIHLSQLAAASSDDHDGESVAQDIETYGIAGRTWEAAYAMRMYLTPPSSSTKHLSFSPPCPLFLSPVPSDSSSTRHSTRKRTIIEVGSGTGYLSICLAPYLPAEDVLVMTDLEEVVELMEKNLKAAEQRWKRVESTQRQCLVLAKPLPWGDEACVDTLFRTLDRYPDAMGTKSEKMASETYILASDLVYFPFLYPILLRTLLYLTAPPDHQNEGSTGPKVTPTLLFSYKVRSLVREQPFWSSFGRWFSFETVLTESRNAEAPSLVTKSEEDLNSPSSRTTYNRFGKEDDIYIFVCQRRRSTYYMPIPGNDEALMTGGAFGHDDQFETMLLNAIEIE